MTAIKPDSQPSAESLENGRLLFAKACTFLIGAVSLNDLPVGPLPEIAFAGRSNVGKSSLINALVRQKALARTSNTPGRTQQLNFFDLGGRLMIADLPGYGYARAPKQQVSDWTDLVGNYLQGRAPLRRVCLLIDGRHGIKQNDREVMDMLDRAAQSFLVVLTKCDKVNPDKLEELVADVSRETSSHVAAHPDVIVTSSVKGLGIEPLRATLAALALDQ
ncbi:MAG: YihA family ribosome biogenesis GTP-binding protein [Rhodospirillaceae bacterium]|nr:YihA family ribosome biogenesis GTP-binding protein [Rhodospirillaceae bacterium]